MSGQNFLGRVADLLGLTGRSVAGHTLTDARIDHRLTLTFTGGGGPREVIMEPGTGNPGFSHTTHFTLKAKGDQPDTALMEAITAALCPAETPQTWAHLMALRRGQPTEEVPPPVLHDGRVEIRINLECNEDCLFCNTGPRAANLYLSRNAVLKAIEHVSGARHLILTGREPTLHPDLPLFVQHARPHCTFLQLQTNATLLWKKDLARVLRRAGLDAVFVSLHATRADLSDTITALPGGFDATLKGIDAALAAGLSVGLNFVLEQRNLHEAPRYGAFVHERFGGQVKEITLSVVAPTFQHPKKWDIIPHFTESAEALKAAIDTATAHGLEPVIPDYCGVPPCTLPDHLRYLDGLTTRQQERSEPPPERAFGPRCDACRLRPACTGTWREMLERYGAGALVPL